MNIKKVVQDSKCRSCGYCFSVCPVNAIDMIYVDSFFKPEVNASQCIQCGKCVKSCPSEHDFAENGLLGSYMGLFLAYSTNREIRHNATSGGVINSLVRFLLKEQIIDGVLMAGYDIRSENETSSQLITLNEMNILEKKTRNFSSRYVLTPVLIELRNIPKEIKKLAVVGTPCQIQALKLGGVMQT